MGIRGVFPLHVRQRRLGSYRVYKGIKREEEGSVEKRGEENAEGSQRKEEGGVYISPQAEKPNNQDSSGA